jgi:hypothetical protein
MSEVCCGSKTEIGARKRKVRFAPKSGRRQLDQRCPKSAMTCTSAKVLQFVLVGGLSLAAHGADERHREFSAAD